MIGLRRQLTTRTLNVIENNKKQRRHLSSVNFQSLKRKDGNIDMDDEDIVAPPMLPSKIVLGVDTTRELVYWTLDDPQSSRLVSLYEAHFSIS